MIVGTAFIARALPLLSAHGAQASAIFDEGVYASAAGLFAHGALPYRDFVMLHPPGLSILLWPLARLAPDTLSWASFLAVCRWLSVLTGVANILLVSRLARIWRGPVAAIAAAAVYAAYAPAAGVERHLLLEPFVTLLTLVAATVWLRRRDAPPSSRGALVAGALAGLAALVKLTGGAVLIAMLASDPVRSRWRARAFAVAASGVVFFGVMAPFAAPVGIDRLFDHMIGAQVHRPGGDVAGGSIGGLAPRLSASVGAGFLGTSGPAVSVGVLTFLLMACAFVWAWITGGREGRFWTALFAATLLTILGAKDFYAQYPAPLGAPIAVVVAAALTEAIAALRARRRQVSLALAATAVAVLAGGLTVSVAKGWQQRAPGAPDFGALARAHLQTRDCVFADPPALALAANRLPARDVSGSALVDPFGALLVPAIDAGTAETTPSALTSDAAQDRERAALAACRWVALGVTPDDDDHLSRATRRWFITHYRPVTPPDSPPTLWTSQPPQGRFRAAASIP